MQVSFKTIFPMGDGKTIFATTDEGITWVGVLNKKDSTIEWEKYAGVFQKLSLRR